MPTFQGNHYPYTKAGRKALETDRRKARRKVHERISGQTLTPIARQKLARERRSAKQRLGPAGQANLKDKGILSHTCYSRLLTKLTEVKVPLTSGGRLKAASKHATSMSTASQARGGGTPSHKAAAKTTGTRLARLEKLSPLRARLERGLRKLFRGGAPRTEAGAAALGDHEGRVDAP